MGIPLALTRLLERGKLLGTAVVRLVLVGTALLATVTVGAVGAVHLSGRQVLVVTSGSMTPVFRAGDAVLVHRPRPQEIRPGAVVSFHAPGRTTLTTHRIVALHRLPQGLFVQTKGDANATPDPDYTPIGNVVAVLGARLPYAGRWLALYQSPRTRLVMLGTPLLLLLAGQLAAFARELRQRASTRRASQIGAAAVLAVLGVAVAGDHTGAVFAATDTVGANTFGTTSCFYQRAVAAAAPTLYYRLNDTAGTAAADSATSPHNGTYSGTWTKSATGNLTCTPNTAVTAAGTSSTVISGGQQITAPPAAFTLEAWINTTDSNGGEIIGFGNSQSGTSTSIDRVLYLTSAGKLALGVTTSAGKQSITTTATYNNGSWHLVDATFSAAGASVYVDGGLAATTSTITSTTLTTYTGYWRVGYDNLSGVGWASFSTQNQYTGSLDELAVYPTALSGSTIMSHYTSR